MEEGVNRTDYTVELPIPDRVLSPNVKVHYRVKSTAVKKSRARSKLVWRQALGEERPLWEEAMSKVIFYLPDRRKRDSDNLSAMLKSVWDGAKDAGILLDDDKFDHAPLIKVLDKYNPRVVLMIKKGRYKDYERIASFYRKKLDSLRDLGVLPSAFSYTYDEGVDTTLISGIFPHEVL